MVMTQTNVSSAQIISTAPFQFTGPPVICQLCRFFIYWLVNSLMHYNSVALFRVMGAFSQTASYANATACAIVRCL
jgi:hypothetical protein